MQSLISFDRASIALIEAGRRGIYGVFRRFRQTGLGSLLNRCGLDEFMDLLRSWHFRNDRPVVIADLVKEKSV